MATIGTRTLQKVLIHAAGIVACLWPALINGQPFFFPDTTAYIRAADLAVQLGSGHRIRTAWSRPAEATPAAAASSAPAAPHAAAPIARGSDGSGGNAVMAGRSPYFGMLLYLAYVLSNFWLFVLGQALVAWWLLGLALRCFGCGSLPLRLGFAVLLGLLSPLAVCLGLLLADALAGLGLLAFLILVRPPPDLRRWETFALVLVMVASAVSHLSHIVMFAGLAALLLFGWLIRLWPRDLLRPALLTAGIAAIGLASVAVTGVVVKRALGKPPAVVPLMTARFIIDGPGRDFIAAGCGGRDFAACGQPTAATDSDIWLWSRDPALGGFLTADAPTRAALSREDTKFALAVLAAYPVRQIEMILRNTWLQLRLIEESVTNEQCMADENCAHADLPPAVHATMRASPAGRGLWPNQAMATVQTIVVVLALIALAAAIVTLHGRDREAARLVLLWTTLLLVALLINALLCGGISKPQGRYEERVIWLIPLLAMLAGLRAWGAKGSLPAGRGNG